MALRFLDSFDHYNTLAQKWNVTGAGTIQTGGRTGPNRLRFANWGDNGCLLTLDFQTVWIIGTAFTADLLPPSPCDIIATWDVGTVQCSVRLDNLGRLSVYRGGTFLAESTRTLLPSTWYYIEFKHIIADAGGLAEVRVNEEVWVSFVGDTQNTGSNTANAIYLKGPAGAARGAYIYYDDLYILDGTGGPPNNDYWGDTQIECKVPNGPGFYTEWTTLVGAATHWEAVDEVPPDEDTSYVASSTLDQRDTFTFQDLSVVSAQINGIQVLIRAREDVAGGVSIARMYRNAGVDNQGADTPINTSYAYYVREIMESDPIAAGPWTVDNINSAEFGVRVRP